MSDVGRVGRRVQEKTFLEAKPTGWKRWLRKALVREEAMAEAVHPGVVAQKRWTVESKGRCRQGKRMAWVASEESGLRVYMG